MKEAWNLLLEFFDPISRVVLVSLFLFLFTVIRIHKSAKEEFNSEKNLLRERIKDLYSPALGLIKSLRSERIDDKEFQIEFRRLLIYNRHLAEDEDLKQALEKWLDGQGDLKSIEKDLIEEKDMSEKKLDNKMLVKETWNWFGDNYISISVIISQIMIFMVSASALFLYFANLVHSPRWGFLILAFLCFFVALTVSTLIGMYKNYKRRNRKSSYLRKIRSKELQKSQSQM